MSKEEYMLRRETGEKLIAAFENGELQKVGNCKYMDSSGKPCAVGYLLSPEEHKALLEFEGEVAGDGLLPKNISKGRMNSEPITRVAAAFPNLPETLLKRTGLTLQDLDTIQGVFDGGCGKFFIERVERLCLVGEVTK